MSISLLTFNNSNIAPADDGILYKALTQDGILSGCNITKSADNEFTISDGYILACGRVIKITSETHNATLTTSGTATYKLYIKINTAVPSAPIEIISGEKSSYIQEDINGNGNIYELELASYTASTTQITAFTSTISAIYAPADYIVERGTTDGWMWEKYASGKIKCYRKIDTGTINVNTAFGNIFITSELSTAIPSMILTIKDVGHSVYLNGSVGGLTLSNTDVQIISTKTIKYWLWSGTSLTNRSLQVYFEIVGTWK